MGQLSSETPNQQSFRPSDGPPSWSRSHPCKNQRLAHILIVDDNHAEARLLVEALKELQLHHHAHIAYSGVEAVDYLCQGSHDHCPPDMVILDLQLPIPSLEGHGVLSLIKTDAALRAIPVVILSGSCHPEDFHPKYASLADCCLKKPIDFDELLELLGKISALWLGYDLSLARTQ